MLVLIFYKEVFQVLGGYKSHICINFYFLELFMIQLQNILDIKVGLVCW